MFRKDVGHCQRFTRAEEADLHAKMVKGGERGCVARDRLFVSCVPWAIRWATSFHKAALHRGNTRANLDDMIQEALWGLLESLDKLDPAKGRLTTIAAYHIRKRLMSYIKTNSLIRIPVAKFAVKDEFNPATNPVKSFAAMTDFTDRDFDAIDDKQPADWPEQNDELRQLAARIRQLPEPQQDVLHKRFWDKKTLKEIGETRGVTRERIRQIETKALDRLREVYKA